MKIRAILACIILLIPGCISEESPDFHGKDLQESDIFLFTLNDQNQSSYSLEDNEGKVIVLAFIYTRCDDVCLLIAQNLKVVKSQMTEDELSKVQFVSVTIDWRHDSPDVLNEWATEMELDLSLIHI